MSDIKQLQKGSDLSAYEFSRYIATIHFEGKFSKTTMPHSHAFSDKLINKVPTKKGCRYPDIGASAGIKAVDLINELIKNKIFNYYITDIISDCFIVYKDEKA